MSRNPYVHQGYYADRKDEDKIVWNIKRLHLTTNGKCVDNIQIRPVYIYYYWLTTGINYPNVLFGYFTKESLK